MNNRFKFRVWEKDQKIMKECTQITLDKEQTGSMCDVKGKVTAHLIYQPHYILMQCTGLKDKNGKLIYEGDILQQLQLPHKVVCEWYKDGFWLNGFMNGAKRELRNMHNWYEVIGNIYENKELLESEG